MREIKEYLDGWALLKDGIEIAFYSKVIKQYTFNCTVISEEDLEWFWIYLHQREE